LSLLLVSTDNAQGGGRGDMRWTPTQYGTLLIAGGSYLDIALAHCVSISTFFRIVDETICDIGDTTTLEFRYEGED
jgi:hypothetical protein